MRHCDSEMLGRGSAIQGRLGHEATEQHPLIKTQLTHYYDKY